MIKLTSVSLPLECGRECLFKKAAVMLGISSDEVVDVGFLKKSIDARDKGNIHFIATLSVLTENDDRVLSKCKNPNASMYYEKKYVFPQKVELSCRPVVIGFGPAGIFAALTLAQAGLFPIVIERGEPIPDRKLSVERFRKTRVLNPESNIQFGEGGAGAFSDGKLNTGTNDIRHRAILKTFVENGAPEEILWDAKPHIGTDMLETTIVNIRRKIESLGGEIIFGAAFVGFTRDSRGLSGIIYKKNAMEFKLETRAAILAVGHSARDVFSCLCKNDISVISKAFSVGVRIEHKRTDIDSAMYGKKAGSPFLGSADYKLAVHLAGGRSLYTFCMCPGGSVVPAASEEGGVVTNGMSCYARDAENSNSALLVGVNPSDFEGKDPLAGVEFQRKIERKAFEAGGGDYSAPVSLVGDFLKKRTSVQLGRVTPSYTPSFSFARPESYLPSFVTETMREGIVQMQRRISCFADSDAVLTGAETRSSSPVRLVRDESCCSVSLRGLYPCGEGAGYAGGIMSAAADGIRCAEAICGEDY